MSSNISGVVDSRYSGKVTHYRGIQYANISRRFSKPEINKQWLEKGPDFVEFGPRCPQPSIDIRKLMQIPKNISQNEPDKEDELTCANLNVTCPSETRQRKLPVLLWIYGGSQMQSFGSASQNLGDPGPLVAQSIDQGKPIILVTPHYRLNIFAFGGGEGEVNLGLQDLRAAITWVKQYIGDFGGDADNITIGGESAGAICTHALLASGSASSVRRAILASACLYTTPPQSDKRSFGMVGLIEGNLQLMELERGNANPAESATASLEGAPVKNMVQTLQDLDITSMWMWREPELEGWENVERVFGELDGIMIGDTEYESIIYAGGISKVPANKISQSFVTTPPEPGKKLAEMYGVTSSDVKANRKAALDFLNDARFAYPAHAIARRVNNAGRTAYQYHFDQVNPFDKSESACSHHAIDLFATFGGYDDFVGEEMKQVGKTLRGKWIDFVNGEAPWNKNKIYAYGPHGNTGEADREDIESKRRLKHYEALEEVAHDTRQEIWLNLMAAIGTSASN